MVQELCAPWEKWRFHIFRYSHFQVTFVEYIWNVSLLVHLIDVKDMHVSDGINFTSYHASKWIMLLWRHLGIKDYIKDWSILIPINFEVLYLFPIILLLQAIYQDLSIGWDCEKVVSQIKNDEIRFKLLLMQLDLEFWFALFNWFEASIDIGGIIDTEHIVILIIECQVSARLTKLD